MEKIITLFNHKGGVSKTTTTFNLAWKISQNDKRVLVVDADPQCNLTWMFLGDCFDEYYESDSTRKMNIKDAVSMAFMGKPQPIKEIDCPQHERNENIFIIPGHMDLSANESALSLAWNSNNAIITLQNLPGAFYELIHLCATKYDIDYVFIDLNPGLSSLNQTFFIYSDAFIIPINPDPFALMALKTLQNILPKWKKMAREARELFDETSYPLPEKEMKFAGDIIQRFSLRKQKPSRPFQEKIKEIQQYIGKDFIEHIRLSGMMYNDERYTANEHEIDFCLGEIPDFGALIQKANEARVPVFALQDEDMKESGVVREGMQERRDKFDEIFKSIAKKIIEVV